MIADMHTHILPNMDDGSGSIEESLAMLDMLENDGVTDVVFTPHFYYRNQSISRFLEKRKEAYEHMKAVYSGKIQFHLGVETEFSYARIDYGVFRELSIDAGRYILLELPFDGEKPTSILSRIEKLIYDTDLIPIIAHVERYLFVQKKPSIVAELINIGCLIQANADSVIQSSKGDLIDALFRHRQIHLLGSDCHNTSARAPCFKKALENVGKTYGMEYVDMLTDASEAVLKQSHIGFTTDERVHKIFGSYK